MSNGKVEIIENKLIEIYDLKQKIQDQTNGLQTQSLSWDRYDFLVAFIAGFTGAAADYFISGGANRESFKNSCEEPSINKEHWLGKYKNYDLKNNPIDMQIPGASAGDHRLYSYGHDLTRISKAIQLLKGETDIIGIHGTGGLLEGVISEKWNSNITTQQALIILALHLYKDFFTARSLPIPGSTLLAELNGNKMPEWLEEAYIEKEFNLRTISGHAISSAIPEILIRVYLFIKYYNEKESKELIAHKRNELLLLSHSIISSANLTKAYIAQNPYLINYSEILRTISLGVSVAVQNSKFTNNLKAKNHLLVANNLIESQVNELNAMIAFLELQELNNKIKKIG